ncbi:MAG TPA: NADH-quinone oxidoreductase subunit H, partial [Ignavibacteriales bacterium]|nr:NADH-quinone oxidoreductase subunit H [Ignavibacteriales bacterium]
EYVNMAIASAMIVMLYLGGWNLPFVNSAELTKGWLVLIPIGIFLFKMAAILFFFIWVRWSLLRFRYDQLMDLGWKVMFPLSLVNIIWVAVLIMIF